MQGRERVRSDAANRGVQIEFVERPEADSLEAAARLLGLEAASVVKTLVVKRSDGTYLFALVPGDRQISWPKLRAVIGVNKLRLPDEHAAFEATGYARGTITPFGSEVAWPVVADASIVGRRVAMGAGEQSLNVFVDADDVIASFAATVADVTELITPS